jgi:N-acetylmuramoyl-L-alanine amidase
VVLDAGHGGLSRGCLGVDGTFEKEVTLEIARRTERILLEETSASVLLTRRDDRALGLADRAALANQWQADVFLSIHLNADPYGRGSGVETWVAGDESELAAADAIHGEEPASEVGIERTFDSEGSVEQIARSASRHKAREDAVVLAHAVVLSLHKGTGFGYRGVKHARFTVLRRADVPAIVVECGFLSHPVEGLALLDPGKLEAIARAIVEGIIAYDRQIGGPPGV